MNLALTVAVAALAGSGVVYGLWWAGMARGYKLNAELRALRQQVKELKLAKDNALAERNRVLAMMVAALQPEGSEDINDVHEWRFYRGYDDYFVGSGNCLYIEAPAATGLGQMCWHFSDEDAWLVDALGLPQHANGWNGTTTDVKYTRINRFVSGGPEPLHH